LAYFKIARSQVVSTYNDQKVSRSCISFAGRMLGHFCAYRFGGSNDGSYYGRSKGSNDGSYYGRFDDTAVGCGYGPSPLRCGT
jgi:hypothetical protein